MATDINFSIGDLVRVHQKIVEDNKTRIQIFQGTVFDVSGRGENKSFSVRKTVGDVVVERIWPVFSPNIEKVEVKSHSKKRVRKAKL